MHIDKQDFTALTSDNSPPVEGFFSFGGGGGGICL
jgi:hypothetical protein